MLTQEIIQNKRDGQILSREEIDFFVAGLTDNSVSESQAAAFAMATWFKGMTVEERISLTEAMRDSGSIMEWPGLDGPVVDKHSTGGVGDNVSLMLAPALAACGAYVPMISGRGLGHTGGTLDKLEAIPGYQIQPDEDTFKAITKSIGCAIIGQTNVIAPADKRLYSIRDVTATVDSIDLITASILSKKLSGGLEALVLDVKCGTGAFMQTFDEAKALADSLVLVANGAGCKTSALITDMSQPLATAAGNAVETGNAMAFLTGTSVDERLWQVTVELGAKLLVISGLETDIAQAHARIETVFHSGAAAEKFAAMVAALGGPNDFLENWETHLPKAKIVREIYANCEGYVAAVDTRLVGNAVIQLGGGRRVASDTIDHSVGFTQFAAIGEKIDAGSLLAMIHASDLETAHEAEEMLRQSYQISEKQIESASQILGEVPGVKG